MPFINCERLQRTHPATKQPSRDWERHPRLVIMARPFLKWSLPSLSLSVLKGPFCLILVISIILNLPSINFLLSLISQSMSMAYIVLNNVLQTNLVYFVCLSVSVKGLILNFTFGDEIMDGNIRILWKIWEEKNNYILNNFIPTYPFGSNTYINFKNYWENESASCFL